MKEIKLLDNEEKVFELEADFWNRGTNPIQRFFGNVARIVAMIFGKRIHGKLIVTNLRALEVAETISCYCFATAHEVKLLTKASIKEVGYVMEKFCFVFCPTYTLYYESTTQSTSINVKNATDDTMNELLTKFYQVIK